jgi:hypothetical protein
MQIQQYNYTYLAVFAGVAASASQAYNLSIDAENDFIVDEIQPEFQLDGSYLSAIDGTPLVAFPTVISGSTLVMPTLAHLRISVQNGANQWQSNTSGVRVSGIKKNGSAWLLSKPVLRASDSILFTLYNDGPATVKGQFQLVGRRVPKGQGDALAAAGR